MNSLDISKSKILNKSNVSRGSFFMNSRNMSLQDLFEAIPDKYFDGDIFNGCNSPKKSQCAENILPTIPSTNKKRYTMHLDKSSLKNPFANIEIMPKTVIPAKTKGISKMQNIKKNNIFKPFIIANEHIEKIEDMFCRGTMKNLNTGQHREQFLKKWDELIEIFMLYDMNQYMVLALKAKGDFYFHAREIDNALFEYRKAVFSLMKNLK